MIVLRIQSNTVVRGLIHRRLGGQSDPYMGQGASGFCLENDQRATKTEVETAPRFTQDLAPRSQLEGASARVRSAAERGRLRGDKSCDFGRAAAASNIARAKDEISLDMSSMSPT